MPLPFTVRRMVNAGFTGRNQEAVRHHIDELAAEGVPVPDSIPTLYPVIRQPLLIGAEKIEVYSGETCGEVEFVILVVNRNEIYVGLGSDHTDRKLEETDIPRAKQICPNLMCGTVWPLRELAGHWDDMVLRMSQTVHGKEALYQEGGMGLLMGVEQLLEFVGAKIPGPLDGYVIFSGTIGNLPGKFVFGDSARAELEDKILGRKLSLAYRVKQINYLEV